MIKTHGSESRGQEEAACMRVFWPTRPLQWVIYTDGSSKILKCCNSATSSFAYSITDLESSNWLESTSHANDGIYRPNCSEEPANPRFLMMVSVTTARTRVIYTMLVNCYITNTFYVMNDLCSKFHPKWLCHCSSTAFQSRLLNRKIFNWQLLFSNSNLFSSHTLWPPWMGLRFVDSFIGILVSLVSQPCLTRFWWNLYFPFPYAYSTSTAIFRLILLLNVTAEHTLHSRVKDSITQNQDCCYS